MLYQIDVDYGLENERICQSKIENFFNEKIIKLDYYNNFDFSNSDNTIMIELKSRRCKINDYADTMINISKIHIAKKLSKNKDKKNQIYFFFYYLKNELYYWKYDDKIDLRVDNNCNYRGIRKPYTYIPTNLLTKIN